MRQARREWNRASPISAVQRIRLTSLIAVTALAAPSAGAGQRPRAQVDQACGVHCGTERWAVKTLSDPDRGRVRMERSVDASVEALVALQRPAILSPSRRADPVELTVYRVEARLLQLRSEPDSDYHLVLASPADSLITMIAEVPNPACAGACASGQADVYRRVRQQLMERLDAPAGEAHPLIRVTGVGFFDFLHGQRGVAPNGIELHPVLDVSFP